MPFHVGRPGSTPSYWEDGAPASSPSSAPDVVPVSSHHGLGEFLPESGEPEKVPSAPLRSADLDQLDALLVAISSRLHTLDDDIDQLRTLSVRAGHEYHRLSDQARVLRLRAAPAPARLPVHGLEAFEVADASAPVDPPPMAPRPRRPAPRPPAAVALLRQLPQQLVRLRPAALPIAGVLVGFLLVPALLTLRGSTSREPANAPTTTPTSAAAVTPVPTPAAALLTKPVVETAATSTATPAPSSAVLIKTPAAPVARPAVSAATPVAAPPVPAPAQSAVRPARASTSSGAVGQLAQGTTTAVRTGFEGTLQVQSIPAGAAVFVNQKYVGETPLMLPRVRAGSNVVWVERPGYERWTAGVLVPTGEVARVVANLIKANGQRH